MGKTWTETVRRVGNEPEFHYEIGPDADGTAIELRYREWDEARKQWVVKESVSFNKDLAVDVAEAIIFVSKHFDDGA